MKKPKWRRNKTAIVELHGDQLYSFFKEHFRGQPNALNRTECRNLIRYAVEDARETVVEKWPE